MLQREAGAVLIASLPSGVAAPSTASDQAPSDDLEVAGHRPAVPARVAAAPPAGLAQSWNGNQLNKHARHRQRLPLRAPGTRWSSPGHGPPEPTVPSGSTCNLRGRRPTSSTTASSPDPQPGERHVPSTASASRHGNRGKHTGDQDQHRPPTDPHLGQQQPPKGRTGRRSPPNRRSWPATSRLKR